MSIIDTLLGYIAPHYCIGCDIEGSLLCSKCDLTEIAPISRCYRCHALTSCFRTCASCRSSTPLRSIIAVRPYAGLHRELIQSLKFNGAQTAAAIIADTMLKYIPEDSMIVPLPTSTRHVRLRGFDHTKLITGRIKHRKTNEIVYALSRVGQQQQRGSNRLTRIKQLEKAYRIRLPHKIVGQRILLIDDVSTTGASLEAAAIVLKRAGAKSVDAIVYAQTR